MADALDRGKEIWHWREPDAALPEAASGDDFRLQFVLRSEKQALAHSDFSAGAHQAFPFVGLMGKLAGQKNFDPSAQKIARGGVPCAERLRLFATPSAIEARGKDARVVKYDQVVGLSADRENRGTRQSRNSSELRFRCSSREAARSEQRLLGDEFFGKRIIEIGNQHAD